MNKSLKAALCSALVFPGAGYFVVRRPLRGAFVVVLALACLVHLISVAVAQATMVVDKVLKGDVPLDVNGISNVVATASATSGSGMANLASLVLLACWIVSTLDAYRIGRQLDLLAPGDASSKPPMQKQPPLQKEAPLQRPAAPLKLQESASSAGAGNITLRMAQRGELPQLLQLYRHLHPGDPALLTTDTVDAAWQAMLANPALRVLVAQSAEGQLVATVTLLIVPNLTRGVRPYALVENVVTDPVWRKRGIATRLLKHAQEMAWGANCYKLMLMTGSKEQETLRFYRNAGFVDGDKTGFVARPDANQSS